MKKEKKTVGRPESAIPTKQINVRMALSKLEDPILKERTKYTSFSQYVNSLIDNDLAKVVPLLTIFLAIAVWFVKYIG